MPLFVQLADGDSLDDDLIALLARRLRAEYSPRHVPDNVYQVSDVPMTLTGKKLEVPVRKILMGVSPAKAANPSVMANPQSLDYFIEFARCKTDYPDSLVES